MALTASVVFGFIVMAILLLSVLGSVHRSERFAFVGGVLLIVIGTWLAGWEFRVATVGGIIALVGFLAIIGSTIPLLRQSARAS